MKFGLKDILYLAVIALLLFFLFKSCNPKSHIGEVTIQTVTKIDTLKSKGDTLYLPQAVDSFGYAVHDTTQVAGETVYVPSPNDYGNDQLITRIYRDSIRLDTSGFAYIKDSVQGKIVGRTTSFFLRIPTTTITKTVSVPQKEKLKMYLGLSYQYPINYIGAGLGLQLKNDNLIFASYGYQAKAPVYGLSYLIKIKLRK